jgi:AraC-like DNA-binding protein
VKLRRIERAKVLMTSTDQQLTDIALICGFADQSHLNRSFRRVLGVSPGRWRRTNVKATNQTRGTSDVSVRLRVNDGDAFACGSRRSGAATRTVALLQPQQEVDL